MLTIRRAGANGAEEISREAAVKILPRGDATLWFHFDSPTKEELRFLQENFHIHHLTIEDIVNQNQRPKIEPFEDYEYLAVHLLRREARWQIEPSELDLLIGRGWLISVYCGNISELIDEAGFKEKLLPALGRGADFLLYTLLDLVVDGYFPILDAFEEEIDALEDRLLLRARRGDMNRLLSLKRSLMHVRRAVTPQREILNQLARHDFPFARPESLVYFRDVYDHLIRMGEEIDNLREMLSNVLEIHLASTSNQLNATMKRLTAYGTIFVVITAIAGIYGMNFKFMPELEWRYGYFAVLGAMAAISLGLFVYFKKRGDL
jgi:magnesium transporter